MITVIFLMINYFLFILGSTWYASVFLVVNAALGAGLLNFPAAYNQSGGIFTAIVIQAVCGMV